MLCALGCPICSSLAFQTKVFIAYHLMLITISPFISICGFTHHNCSDSCCILCYFCLLIWYNGNCRYTSKMLLAAIDEHHRGTYDFIYLPIDFKVSKSCMDWISLGKKITYDICTYLIRLFANSVLQNKCNVGYAFVNMIGPLHIVPLHQVWIHGL